MYIIDAPTDGSCIPHLQQESACFKVVISSPEYKRYSKLPHPKVTFYAPPWTLAELETAIASGLSNAKKRLLEIRFKIFGGAARLLFSPPEKEYDVDGQVANDLASLE